MVFGAPSSCVTSVRLPTTLASMLSIGARASSASTCTMLVIFATSISTKIAPSTVPSIVSTFRSISASIRSLLRLLHHGHYTIIGAYAQESPGRKAVFRAK